MSGVVDTALSSLSQGLRNRGLEERPKDTRKSTCIDVILGIIYVFACTQEILLSANPYIKLLVFGHIVHKLGLRN